jgi:hypothetical protein
MAEACRDWRGDVAALALDRIGPADRVRVVAHVDGCDACRAALAELSRAAAVLVAADPSRLQREPSAPAALAERILHEVQSAKRRAGRRRRVRAATAIAAVAAAVVLVAGVALLRHESGPELREFAVEAPGVDARFAILPNDQGTAVRLVHHGLDPDDVYWLWLTDAAGRRVSAGTFRGTSDGEALTLQSALPAADAVRIWVTDANDSVVLDTMLPR